MTQEMAVVSVGRSRKRKAVSAGGPVFPLDELHQDLLEPILARLPASSFFRLRSVCKRWRSAANSATFLAACSQIARREPWFLMVDQQLDRSIIFDSGEWNWKRIGVPPQSSIPVAASGGLVCYRTASGGLYVVNPLTGLYRELPPANVFKNQTLLAVVMHAESMDSYRIVLITGEFPNLSTAAFDSQENRWEDNAAALTRKFESSSDDIEGEDAVYFLSKSGDVVSTNMQRSPSKQFWSVAVHNEGEEVVYFITTSGTVAACNLAQGTFSELPRLLPVFCEYSIDIVRCNGEMLAVVLSEFLETASLRIWRFCRSTRSWHQVAAMPPPMSHEFYGKKADINCAGHGDAVLICLCSGELSSCFMCRVNDDCWVELPKYYPDGSAVDRGVEFLSAFPFEPRLEAIA